jgi:DNA-binding MarR family transcriptional regulator
LSSDEHRQKLLEAVTFAIYDNSTVAVFFHTAVAEQVGLGATEEKTLLILSGFGRLTAGEIAQHTGLTTASVTSLIDRLETKGFVRRVRDDEDRRRVFVELIQERFVELTKVFASLQGTFDDMLTSCTDEELIIITKYLNLATQRSREAIFKLRQNAQNQEDANT